MSAKLKERNAKLAAYHGVDDTEGVFTIDTSGAAASGLHSACPPSMGFVAVPTAKQLAPVGDRSQEPSLLASAPPSKQPVPVDDRSQEPGLLSSPSHSSGAVASDEARLASTDPCR